MRILKVTQAYHPFFHRGGPAIKVRSIARGLVDLGHQVSVLTADLGFQSRYVQDAAATRAADGWHSQLDGVETTYLGTQLRYRNLTVNSGAIRFSRNHLRQFDLVHIYGLYDTLGPIVGRHCRQGGVPYIIEPLGMMRPIDRGFALKKLWKRLAASYLENANRFIVTSELERSELLAEGVPRERVLLRYNGIDLQEFRTLPPPGTFRRNLGLADGDRYILFLGRVIPRKGADLLIEALSRIADVAVKLVIAGPEGESGYLQFLQTKARDLNVAGRVLFPGALFGDDKKAALLDAFAFALPSRYENFGNSVIEATACGTPVIVSDQCGVAPLVNGRSGLVARYDSVALVEALCMLLDNAPLYERLKAGCRQVSEEVSWDKLLIQLERCYRDLSPDRQLQSAAVA